MTLTVTSEQQPVEVPTYHPAAADSRRGGQLLIVDFEQLGNSAVYRTFGWSGQEDTYVWTIGGGSGLRLPPAAEVSPLVLDIDFSICIIEPLLNAAVVRVFANGHPIGAARVTGRTRLRCAIPAGLVLAGEPIDLRLLHPCFVRTDFIDFGADDRPLGLCVYTVCVYAPWLMSAAAHLLPSAPDCVLIHATAPSGVPAGQAVARFVYRFGMTAPDRHRLGNGWRFDHEGNTWADARTCHVELPAPPQPGQYVARFDIRPMLIRHISPTQRISILLAGAVIGQFRVGIGTSLSIPLPPELFEPGQVLRFDFAAHDGVPMHEFDSSRTPCFLSFILDAIEIQSLPLRHSGLAGLRSDDAALPAPVATSERFLEHPVDDLPGAVKDALGVDMAEILRQFESLGDNCSFGLAQQKGGCDVLGLLRFANTPLPKLLTALEDEFRAASDKAQITMQWVPSDPGEFVLSVERYGIRWHSNVFDVSADQATIFAQQTMRLSYLRRKFYEGLNAGRKIFAISRAEPKKNPIPIPDADELPYWEAAPESFRLAEILPLFLKLNEYGTNTVLYLTRCANGRRSGTVELIAPGIMRGYVDDFVITQHVDTKDHAAWLRIAVNAWLLHQGPNASFRNKPAS